VFWFIPSTHKMAIVALLVIAAVAFVLFWVTRVLARRQSRRENRLSAQAAVRHGIRVQEPPPAAPRDE
jgi:membrane protein YdbS with pleckstrin-like domain